MAAPTPLRSTSPHCYVTSHIQIKEEGDIPKASEFFTKYAAGWGKPFVMKGAAKKMTAYKEWMYDKSMAKRFPSAMFTQVRLGLQPAAVIQ